MKIYKAKKDKSMGIFLLGISSFVVFVTLGMPLLLEKELTRAVILSSLVLISILGLFIWVWLGTQYSIADGVLKAKSGPFYWKIRVDEINKILLNQPTVGGIIKFTLSFTSMEIIYKKYNSIYILPIDQEEFIQDLKTINSSIEVMQKRY